MGSSPSLRRNTLSSTRGNARSHSLGIVAPAAALLLTFLMLALGGCTLDISSFSNTSPTNSPSSGTATATPSATPTVEQACRTLLNATSVQAATAGQAFADVTFPPNSLGTGVTNSHGGDGRFTIAQFDVCTPSSSIAAIQSFYSTGLPSGGWAQSGTFPYDGAMQAACGDPYCWSKDTAPRYVSLESVASQQGGYVTYHLRLAIPPTPPSCQPDDYGIYASRPYDTTLPNTPALPAPPLTKDGIGSAGTNGNVTEGGYAGMCSAGSGTSIDSFFTTELSKLGWTTSAPPSYFGACGMSGTLYWKNRDMFQWQTNGSAGASGTFWSFTLCHVASS